MHSINKNPSSVSAVEVVQGFYTALGNGDVPGVLGLLDDQVRWTEAERFPYYGGTWVGPQAVLDNLLKRLVQEWDPFSATADDFVVQGDRVVSLGHYAGTYRKTGKSVRAPFAHVWSVADGKISSFAMYTDTAKILEALW